MNFYLSPIDDNENVRKTMHILDRIKGVHNPRNAKIEYEHKSDSQFDFEQRFRLTNASATGGYVENFA